MLHRESSRRADFADAKKLVEEVIRWSTNNHVKTLLCVVSYWLVSPSPIRPAKATRLTGDLQSRLAVNLVDERLYAMFIHSEQGIMTIRTCAFDTQFPLYRPGGYDPEPDVAV